MIRTELEKILEETPMTDLRKILENLYSNGKVFGTDPRGRRTVMVNVALTAIAELMSEPEIRKVVEEVAWRTDKTSAQHYNIHYGPFHGLVAQAIHQLWLKKCGVK